ncbi:MOSC domain-containing protein [Aquitalea sp. LB_tupeE]|uniref:MOSC domain-containing protein n=1 Tax=Aquitalea sp. LB_tupeE TaxID=2748078 RepID=UPI0015B8CC80|nr:MOSC domain-containing protein [Aquitalea sp. LB_tupeE]NWK77370.1 MOSC domain-containing protein [Aquitalea sp. LB_tupeE]
MKLTQMFVHPMKSARGIAYDRAFASTQGLLHDREWLLSTADGQFLTARQHPRMLQITTALIPGGLLLGAPGRSPVLAMTQVYKQKVAATVWRANFTAWHGDEHVDAWLSDYLGIACRLLWLGMHSTRLLEGAATPMSFADGYPYLLVNQASLDALNQDLRKPVTVQHFRPNLLVTGGLPYEEDDWKVIQIGDIVFEVAKPCTRCQMITTDPISAEVDADNEPMLTLSKTRQQAEGICFGVNLVARNEGILEIGAPVQVLESRYAF